MNLEEFINETKNIGINLTAKNLKDLKIYKELLQEYNLKFNLTTIIQDKDIYLKHFYDSLTLAKVLDLNQNLKLLDIGTGAGLPGLVLKIIFPKLDITLIDSNHKKIEFLNTVIDKLNLTNIICINTRAENLSKTYLEYFDIVTSRAVSHIRILLELSIPYLKTNGLFVPLKGNVKEELEESKTTLQALNAKVIEVNNFRLPIENSERTILKIKKIAKTASKYPRKYDQIKKSILR